MVAHHPQHRFRVCRIARKSPQLARHFGRGRITDTGHDRTQYATQRTTLVRVVAKAHIHQQSANIGKPKPGGAELVGKFSNLRRRELRHHHRNFERHHPQPAGMNVAVGIKLAILQERQQVDRGKVARRIIKEHVF